MGAARAKRQNTVMVLERRRGPLDSLAVLLKAAQNPTPMARSRRPKNFAIDHIAIADDVAPVPFPAAGFGQLPRNPFGTQVRRTSQL
jgi:hypothetical protein